MTNTFTEQARPGAFVESDAPGRLSYEAKAFSGGAFVPGEVVAEVGGKYVKFDPAAADGSEVAAAISVFGAAAADADVVSLAVVRLAEVTADRLVWPEALADPTPHIAELAAKFVIVRNTG